MNKFEQAVLEYMREDQPGYQPNFGWSVGAVATALGETLKATRDALEHLAEEGHIVQRGEDVYGLTKVQHSRLQEERE
ncbi:MAG: hypothetical protein KIS85_06255 [Anaerolineales bacterium]|nr:hypothetical protein [Anaerolineales bacterium]